MSSDVGEAFGIESFGIKHSDENGNISRYDTGGFGPPFLEDGPIGTHYLDSTNNVRYRKVLAGTGVNAWAFDVPRFPLCTLDGGVLETSKIVEIFDNAGGTQVPVLPVVDALPFPSVRAGSDLSNYSFPSPGQIEFLSAGDYLVQGHASFIFVSGGFKTILIAPRLIPIAGGPFFVPGSFGATPVVNAQLNMASAPFGCMLNNVQIGDIFELGMTIITGAVTVNTNFGSYIRITPVIPKANTIPLIVDCGEYDGNPNKEPKALIDGGEL